MQLGECINFLLTGAQHKVFQEMKRQLKIYDLTPIQYGVLKCIWQMESSNPKEIAEYLGIENSTISGVLERMEAKGFIQRKIDSNDRRFIKIYLTEKTKKLEKPVSEIVEQVNQKMLKNYTEDEVKEFKNYLRRIIAI